jgi:plasmid stabilization system protein ParE
MRVRYTDTAAHELDKGIEYLTEHAPLIVVEFADAIAQGVKDLTEFPFSAQKTEKKGVRRKYVRRFHYSIFYAVENDEIIVLHIRHAAQRLPWEDDGR